MVFIRSNRHKENLPQHHRNIVIQLPFATNSGIEISNYALFALKQIFKYGYRYKKAGVIVQDFIPEGAEQMSLFHNRDLRHIPLMKAIDSINKLWSAEN